MGKLAIIDEDSEYERARYWRARIMLLKPQQLAEQIGWAWGEIYKHERGQTAPGVGIQERHWLKYKMACAGLHAKKYGWTPGKAFEWRL